MISELRTNHLFTPERLFGEIATTGLARHAVFLERAKTEAGRDEVAARVALAAYLVVRLVDAYLSVDSVNGVDHEGLRWQQSAIRKHVDELPADLTEIGHLVGIVDAVPLEGNSANTLRISLTAFAYFLAHESRHREALEISALAARIHKAPLPVGDFVAMALFAARLNRRLARWDDAVKCYEAAQQAAETIGDHAARLRGLLGPGSVSRDQGNLPKARAIAEDVLKQAAELQLAEVQAIAYSDLSAIYTLQGMKLEALEADYQAFLLTPDAGERMRALCDLGISLLEIGAYDVARLAFDIVVDSKANFRVRMNALIESMDLEASVGNRVAFERLRSLAEVSRERMPPSMATDYLYKTGIGLARFGQVARGCQVLQTAIGFAETHKLNTWYFKLEGAIRDLEKVQREQEIQTAQMAELSHAPIVEQMEAGLREYAALQSA
jgi:tetratricopeptide (TPR) repeat protein